MSSQFAQKILWDPPRWCENCDKDQLCLLAFLSCFFFSSLIYHPNENEFLSFSFSVFSYTLQVLSFYSKQ